MTIKRRKQPKAAAKKTAKRKTTRKKSARRRPAKTSLARIRKEVNEAFVAKAGALSKTGQAALDRMFDLTIKRFKQLATVTAPDLDIWTTKNGKFRTFILGEARKIGEAARAAATGSVDGTELNRAGVAVMLASNAQCQIAISRGRLILDQLAGPVCSAFLQNELGS